MKQFTIYQEPARSILSDVSGFLAQAGFTHSLTPARNCTYACTYCYVPTMRICGGLKPEGWQRSRIDRVERAVDRRFATGPEAFNWLTRASMEP